MKVNRATLCQAFMRDWEITCLPEDFPKELTQLLDALDEYIKDYEGYHDNLYVNNDIDENQQSIMGQAIIDINTILEKFKGQNIPTDVIKQLFNNSLENLK